MAVAEGDEGSNEDSDAASDPSQEATENELIETLDDTSAPVDEDKSEIQYEEEDRSFEEKIKEITIKRAINKGAGIGGEKLELESKLERAASAPVPNLTPARKNTAAPR